MAIIWHGTKTRDRIDETVDKNGREKTVRRIQQGVGDRRPETAQNPNTFV